MLRRGNRRHVRIQQVRTGEVNCALSHFTCGIRDATAHHAGVDDVGGSLIDVHERAGASS